MIIPHKDYVDLISSNYQDRQCYNTGPLDNYNTIIWPNNDPIPQPELDNLFFEFTKKQCIQDLSKYCGTSIMQGFTSSALGTPYVYDSEEVDQLNLIGAHAATDSTYSIFYACRDVQTGQKSYQMHTHEQISEVLRDGANTKLYYLQKFFIKKQQIIESKTLDEIANVVWED